MSNTKAEILKQKYKDEKGGVIVLHRLTKLVFLPKFQLLDTQAVLGKSYVKRFILRLVLKKPIRLWWMGFVFGVI